MKRKYFIGTVLTIILVFIYACSRQYRPSNYPINKELFNDLHTLSMEIGKHLTSIRQERHKITIQIQKEKMYDLSMDILMLIMSVGDTIGLLQAEFIHAERKQFNSDAIAHIIGGVTGIIDITDRKIKENDKLLPKCSDPLVTEYYKKTNELFKKTISILKEVQTQLYANIENPEEFKAAQQYLERIIK